jgi:integrase
MISDTYNEELISNYLESRATLSENSLKAYEYALTRFSKETGIQFVQVKEKNVAAWINNFEYKETRKTYLTILRTFYDWLIKRKLTEENPCVDIKIRNGLKKKQNYMSQEDLDKILSQCSGLRERTIILFLWYTGVRSKEFVNIKISDVDFDNEILNIRISKTSTGQRKIDIHPNLKPVLREYMKVSDKIRSEKSIDNPYLFLTKFGSKFQLRTLQHLISKLQINLPFNYGAHDFRRAFVTNVYFATKDIVLAQELAGHTSIETTRKYILDDPRMRDDKSRRFKAINF